MLTAREIEVDSPKVLLLLSIQIPCKNYHFLNNFVFGFGRHANYPSKGSKKVHDKNKEISKS